MAEPLAANLHQQSPSTRREWIEIVPYLERTRNFARLPPHGGSGLKYRRRGALEQSGRLPPHGGSGLKLWALGLCLRPFQSPSTRREWIEMCVPRLDSLPAAVSLHTEGVD